MFFMEGLFYNTYLSLTASVTFLITAFMSFCILLERFHLRTLTSTSQKEKLNLSAISTINIEHFYTGDEMKIYYYLYKYVRNV